MRLLATATGGLARSRCIHRPCTRPFSFASARWKGSTLSYLPPPGTNGEGTNQLRNFRDERYKSWDFAADVPPKNGYKVLTSAIIPRPIAFVSSVSAEGAPNLAPFSYFSMVSHNPPLLSISFSLSPRRPKDTRENILSTKKFTVNIISDDFIEAANSTSVEAPADVDEWLISGLTMAYGVSEP
ncbi:hypothetical protein PTI98_006612 [Pleurotus ostreatus]|nr:hypothetical protein PTI98_006612 [Pleurotus ostreatus]